MEWFEELPDSCPPRDSFFPDGFVGYRLLRENKVKDSDFRGKLKVLNKKADLCILKGISLFAEIDQAKNVWKLPTKKNSGPIIAKVTLRKSDGAIKRTFSSPGHHTWWRSSEFDIESVQIL